MQLSYSASAAAELQRLSCSNKQYHRPRYQCNELHARLQLGLYVSVRRRLATGVQGRTCREHVEGLVPGAAAEVVPVGLEGAWGLGRPVSYLIPGTGWQSKP